MAFDYKKEYKALYQPPCTPHLITVPSMTFAAVRGQGDPNDPAGEYKAAVELLYGLLYTIKMSKKGSYRMEGYFDFVVPPLEGLWEQSSSSPTMRASASSVCTSALTTTSQRRWPGWTPLRQSRAMRWTYLGRAFTTKSTSPTPTAPCRKNGRPSSAIRSKKPLVIRLPGRYNKRKSRCLAAENEE